MAPTHPNLPKLAGLLLMALAVAGTLAGFVVAGQTKSFVAVVVAIIGTLVFVGGATLFTQ